MVKGAECRCSYLLPEDLELAHLQEVGQVEDRLHLGSVKNLLEEQDHDERIWKIN